MEKPRELLRLESVLEHCRRREDRARERLERATVEVDEAASASSAAAEAIDVWVAANPDPQRSMF